jgi:RNA polymerase sigma-70 factor, ECF subfamily
MGQRLMGSSFEDPADPTDLGDAALAAAIVRGDEQAFMTVYDRYADALYGTAVRFLRDRELAADVVQESLLAVWRRAGQYDPAHGSLTGWVLGIARNRAIDRLRAAARRPTVVASRLDGGRADPSDGSTDPLDRRLGPDADEPEAEVDRRWTRALLRTTLSELEAGEREVLVLAYDESLSQSEIAARLGLPIGTVKSRTRRALARLRIRLATVPDLRPEGSVAIGSSATEEAR